jgi:hypothetical protein
MCRQRAAFSKGNAMIVATKNDTETRICNYCCEYRLITDFRLVRRNGTERHRECRACRARQDAERRERQRAKRDGDRVAKWVTEAKNETDRKRIERLVEFMVKSFGGVHEFAALWAAQLKKCVKSNPGSKRAMDGIAVVLKLSEQVSQKPADDENVSDEDLARQFNRLVLMMIEDQPESVADAMQRAGWTVTAPE